MNNIGAAPESTDGPKKFAHTAADGNIAWLTRAEIAALNVAGLEAKADAAAEAATVLDRELATYASLDDVGNQMRLVKRFGRELRFCDSGDWYHYSSPTWSALKNDGRVRENAIEVTRLMNSEIDTIEDDPEEVVEKDGNGKPKPTQVDVQRAAYAAWRKTSRSSRKIGDMVTMARSHADISAVPNDFDSDPWLLAVGNGVLDLRTRAVRPATPEDMLTQAMGLKYEADASCPTWETFLERIQPDPTVREYLKRYLGYCLTGLVRSQIFLFFLGGGANGKGTFLDTMAAVFGDHHARLRASIIAGGTTYAAEARFGLAPIVGRRLVTFGELEERSAFNEGLLKNLTGEDIVEIETKGRQAYQYQPICKIILAGNHKPKVLCSDDSVWRRMKLVPFEVTIPTNQRDPLLRGKLLAELPGVLNWALDGLDAYLKEGMGADPRSVAEATAEYKEDSDVLGQFLSERCYVEPRLPQLKALGGDLYAHYNAWCSMNGYKALANNSFATRLKDRGAKKGEGRSRYTWLGIRIITDLEREKIDEWREARARKSLIIDGEVQDGDDLATMVEELALLDQLNKTSGPGAEGVGTSPPPPSFSGYVTGNSGE